MGLQRFFIPQIDPSSDQIIFSKEITHQIKHVLRMQPGQQVVVMDGEGRSFQVEISFTGTDRTQGRIISVEDLSAGMMVHPHLFFPLSRREKVEWVLQKGTEVGVHAFHPFISQRSLVQDVALNAKKRTRWEAIIREAAEQSRRAALPVLHDPGKLHTLVREAANSMDGMLAAVVGEDHHSIKKVLQEMRMQLNKGDQPPSIGLFVGPEGGFAESEVKMLQDVDILTVSLGAHVLRLETAAVVFPALVVYEFNDSRGLE